MVLKKSTEPIYSLQLSLLYKYHTGLNYFNRQMKQNWRQSQLTFNLTSMICFLCKFFAELYTMK